MSRITREQFCPVYRDGALAGKSALEIGRELGIEKDTDEEVSQFVSQKASNYRKELKAQARAKAVEEGLSDEEVKAAVEAAGNMLPKLQTRTRESSDLLQWMSDLIAEADAEPNPSE